MKILNTKIFHLYMNIENSIPFNQKRRPSVIYVNSESNYDNNDDNNDDDNNDYDNNDYDNNIIINSKKTKHKKNKVKVYCCLGYIFFPPKNKKIYP